MWTWKKLREVLNNAEQDGFDLDQPIVLADRSDNTLMTFSGWEQALFYNEPEVYGLDQRAASMEICPLFSVKALADIKQDYIDEIDAGWLNNKHNYLVVPPGPYNSELCEFVEAELNKRGIKFMSHIDYGDGSDEYYKVK
jgi:hypothetical protein